MLERESMPLELKATILIIELAFFIQIAGKINRLIREMGLRDLGQLEQDLVFGDAGAKEVINFLRMNQVKFKYLSEN